MDNRDPFPASYASPVPRPVNAHISTFDAVDQNTTFASIDTRSTKTRNLYTVNQHEFLSPPSPPHSPSLSCLATPKQRSGFREGSPQVITRLSPLATAKSPLSFSPCRSPPPRPLRSAVPLHYMSPLPVARTSSRCSTSMQGDTRRELSLSFVAAKNQNSSFTQKVANPGALFPLSNDVESPTSVLGPRVPSDSGLAHYDTRTQLEILAFLEELNIKPRLAKYHTLPLAGAPPDVSSFDWEHRNKDWGGACRQDGDDMVRLQSMQQLSGGDIEGSRWCPDQKREVMSLEEVKRLRDVGPTVMDPWKGEAAHNTPRLTARQVSSGVSAIGSISSHCSSADSSTQAVPHQHFPYNRASHPRAVKPLDDVRKGFGSPPSSQNHNQGQGGRAPVPPLNLVSDERHDIPMQSSFSSPAKSPLYGNYRLPAGSLNHLSPPVPNSNFTLPHQQAPVTIGRGGACWGSPTLPPGHSRGPQQAGAPPPVGRLMPYPRSHGPASPVVRAGGSVPAAYGIGTNLHAVHLGPPAKANPCPGTGVFLPPLVQRPVSDERNTSDGSSADGSSTSRPGTTVLLPSHVMQTFAGKLASEGNGHQSVRGATSSLLGCGNLSAGLAKQFEEERTAVLLPTKGSLRNAQQLSAYTPFGGSAPEVAYVPQKQQPQQGWRSEQSWDNGLHIQPVQSWLEPPPKLCRPPSGEIVSCDGMEYKLPSEWVY
eukprot:TRINITY_DN152_c0_g1_i1.p1 TRINITY_DN152_c0_g1~~TRINITY_DN152_c0_g1_i1.p1  ORF type:complete len:707 (-),score=60.45 TRINITY_DN152_c0_g1_i1:1639-3759(-)